MVELRVQRDGVSKYNHMQCGDSFWFVDRCYDLIDTEMVETLEGAAHTFTERNWCECNMECQNIINAMW